jgi:hypothetical protein
MRQIATRKTILSIESTAYARQSICSAAKSTGSNYLSSACILELTVSILESVAGVEAPIDRELAPVGFKLRSTDNPVLSTGFMAKATDNAPLSSASTAQSIDNSADSTGWLAGTGLFWPAETGVTGDILSGRRPHPPCPPSFPDF